MTPDSLPHGTGCTAVMCHVGAPRHWACSIQPQMLLPLLGLLLRMFGWVQQAVSVLRLLLEFAPFPLEVATLAPCCNSQAAQPQALAHRQHLAVGSAEDRGGGVCVHATLQCLQEDLSAHGGAGEPLCPVRVPTWQGR